MLLVVHWIFESNSPSCWRVFFYVTSLSPNREAQLCHFLTGLSFVCFVLYFHKGEIKLMSEFKAHFINVKKSMTTTKHLQ